jgi:hypothetical protein
MSNDTAIAVDVAKKVFQVGISERSGQVRRTERLQRAQFLPFLAAQPPSTVVMEACPRSVPQRGDPAGADHVMARSPQGSNERGRRYVCSPSRLAVP